MSGIDLRMIQELLGHKEMFNTITILPPVQMGNPFLSAQGRAKAIPLVYCGKGRILANARYVPEKTTVFYSWQLLFQPTG